MPLQDGAINQILSFATGVANPNIQNLEEYLLDPARLGGNVSGLARSKFMNRTWRQSAHMSAGLAQFIANRSKNGVRDDGDLDKVEAGLATAVMHNFVWLPTANYGVPSLVFGPDMKIYLALQPSGPAVAGVGAKDPTDSASNEFWLDYAASITPPPAEKYDIAQYSWFEDDMPRDGLFSCLGGVVTNFAAKYPKAAAYFETSYGQKRLVTQAEYDALHVYSWYTSSDGIKVGWNGIGGVAKFVWDKQADTLRLPDLAGMTPEQVGFSDSLGVGAVRPDQIRNIKGTWGGGSYGGGGGGTGSIYSLGVQFGGIGLPSGKDSTYLMGIDASRVVPTGPRNHGPRWVSDARVYLGQPTS